MADLLAELKQPKQGVNLLAELQGQKPPIGRAGRSQRFAQARAEEQAQQEATTANLAALQSGDITAQQLTPEQIEAVQAQRVEQLPELAEVGVRRFVDGEGLEGLGTSFAALTTLDPQELGDILTTQFPQVGIVLTPEGVQIAVNRETGSTVAINRPGISSTDILQGLGLVAAFTPAGKAATAAPAAIGQFIGRPVASKLGVAAGAQAATAGATETAIQAFQAASGGEFNADEIALAAGLAGGFELAVPAARNLLQQARNLRAQGVETAEEATRRGLFEARGIQPTRPQVTQAPGEFQTQTELATREGPVRELLEQQEQRFSEAFEQQARDTGGDVATSGSTPIDEIVTRSVDIDQNISDLYKAARERAPDAKDIRLEKLSSIVKSRFGEDRISKGLLSALKSDLKNRGVIDDSFKVTGRVGVDTAEQVRQTINSFFNSTSDRGRSLIRTMKDAIDEDVLKASGEDLFAQARTAKADFEKSLSRAKISKFDDRRSNLVRDILENKVDPDNFVSDVIFKKKWRAEDVNQMKSFLNQTDQGKQAFNDIRATVLDELRTQSFTPRGELSASGLGRNLNKIGKAKLDVLFSKKELRFLKDMKEVANLRTPRRAAGIGTPSQEVVKEVKSRFPGFGPLFDSLSNFKKSRLILRLPKKRKSTKELPDIQSPGAPVQTIRQGEE